MVAVVDGEFADIGTGEFSRTSSTNPWIHLQCLLTTALFAVLAVAPRLGNYQIKFVVVDFAL